MSTETVLERALISAGASPKQAAAFYRWIEDSRPVGVGVALLEKAITRILVEDTKLYVSTMNELARVNEQLENSLAVYRHHFDDSLYR